MFKRILRMTISIAFLLGVVACSDDSNKFTMQETNESELHYENDDVGNENNPGIDDNESEGNEGKADGNSVNEYEEDHESTKESLIPEEIKDFDESITLIKQLDIEQVTADVQTDNQNNRVIILSDDQHKKRYKSIFVKRQNRLKIIDLVDDVQIFNEVLD